MVKVKFDKIMGDIREDDFPDGGFIFKGSITVNTDFSLIADVQVGWYYTVLGDVTDNAGVLYTNTGQSFIIGDEIIWDGTQWVLIGPNSIWLDDGTDVKTVNAVRDLDMQDNSVKNIGNTQHDTSYTPTGSEPTGTTYYDTTEDTLLFKGSDGDRRLENGAITKDPTGFTEPGDVIVTGDPTARTVTLTGTVVAYWKGIRVDALVSGWESAAHDNTTTNVYYLYYDGTNYIWSSTTWTFDKLQIAYAFYDPMGMTWVYIRETHGMQGHLSHEEDHDNIGTYKKSGGDLASYVLDSTTVADRRPTVSEAVIKDEDLPSTLTVLNTGLYTHAELVGSGAVSTFDIDNTDIVELSGNNPYYNEFDGADWVETLMPANSVMSVWLYAIPMAADAVSQKYRFVWGQGQWITQAKNSSGTKIAIAQASEELRSIGEMNLGTLTAISPEFVAIQRIIITYTGGNWYINDVLALTGSKFSQGQSPSGNFLSSVSTDTTLTGAGTVSDPLSAVGLLQATGDMSITNSVSNADIIFTINDGGVSKELLTFDASYPSIYTSNCSFGINVAGPETYFHVNSLTGRQAATFQSETTGAGIVFKDATTSDDTGIYGEADDLYFTTNGSEKLRITSAGLVRVLDGFKLTLGSGDDGQIYSSSDDLYIENVRQDADIHLRVNDGGVNRNVITIDGASSLTKLAAHNELGSPTYTESVTVLGNMTVRSVGTDNPRLFESNFTGAPSTPVGEFVIFNNNVDASRISATSSYFANSVAIGQSSVATRTILDVVGTAAGTARMAIVETADTTDAQYCGLYLYDNATFKGGMFKNGASHDISLWTTTKALTILAATNAVGIGTEDPLEDIAGGGANLNGIGLHIKKPSGNARFVVEGSGLVDIIFADSGAAADEKMLRLVVNDGNATFSAPADNLGTGTGTVLDIDLNTAAISMPGVVTLGDSSQLATSAAPTADADIANKKYVDDNGGSTTTTQTAGEAIAQYSAVGPARNGTSGRLYKMDANASNRIHCTGVATTSAAGAGNTFEVALPGQTVTNGSWSFTVGLPVTVSTAAGVCLTTTAHLTSGRYMIQVGVALTSTSMIVMPQLAHYIDPAGI